MTFVRQRWLSLLAPLLLIAAPVYAQNNLPDAPSGGLLPANIPECNFTTGKFGPNCVPIYIGYLVEWLLGLVAAFFIINVMFAGYQITMGYATGSGIENGLNRLKSSILGLAVAVLVFVIIDLAILVIGG